MNLTATNLGLILGSVFCSAVAQILLRLGMRQQKLSCSASMSFAQEMFTCFITPSIVGALFLYGISLVVWMVALSRVEVSLAYPFFSLSFILVLLASYFFLGEAVGLGRICGVLLICAGVIVIVKYQ